MIIITDILQIISYRSPAMQTSALAFVNSGGPQQSALPKTKDFRETRGKTNPANCCKRRLPTYTLIALLLDVIWDGSLGLRFFFFYGFGIWSAILKYSKTKAVNGRQAFSLQVTEFRHLFPELTEFTVQRRVMNLGGFAASECRHQQQSCVYKS